jgi:hypothetical protein
MGLFRQYNSDIANRFSLCLFQAINLIIERHSPAFADSRCNAVHRRFPLICNNSDNSYQKTYVIGVISTSPSAFILVDPYY